MYCLFVVLQDCIHVSVLHLLALPISLERWQSAIRTLLLVIILSLWPTEFPASIIHCVCRAPNLASCRCLKDAFLTHISPFFRVKDHNFSS